MNVTPPAAERPLAGCYRRPVYLLRAVGAFRLSPTRPRSVKAYFPRNLLHVADAAIDAQERR